jgi:sigma-E factor negative regulatory protein RseC
MAEMLTRTGVVKAVQGHLAVVITRMEPECESCTAKDACLTMGGGGADAEVKARNTVGAEVGDIVTISLRGSSLVKASFLVYMLPILALIGGSLIGHFLSKVIPIDQNILVGVLALFAFCGTFIWLKKKGNQFANQQDYVPEIVSRKRGEQPIPPGDVGCPMK